MEFLNSPLYTWVVLPLLIFAARIVDVSLGTIRLIFITRGLKYFAALVGFLEILIWLLAIGQIFRNLNNIACYLAYAAGFASGSFLGIYFAERLSIGRVIVRIITAQDATALVECLKSRRYGVTTVDAQGAEGPVTIVFSIINRENLKTVIEIIKQFSAQAFYSIEDVKFATEGIFPEQKSLLNWTVLEMVKPYRKSK